MSLGLDGAGPGAMWDTEKALEMLAGSGFAEVEVKQSEEDVINYYTVARKGDR